MYIPLKGEERGGNKQQASSQQAVILQQLHNIQSKWKQQHILLVFLVASILMDERGDMFKCPSNRAFMLLERGHSGAIPIYQHYCMTYM